MFITGIRLTLSDIMFKVCHGQLDNQKVCNSLEVTNQMNATIGDKLPKMCCISKNIKLEVT